MLRFRNIKSRIRWRGEGRSKCGRNWRVWNSRRKGIAKVADGLTMIVVVTARDRYTASTAGIRGVDAGRRQRRLVEAERPAMKCGAVRIFRDLKRI